MRVASLFAAIVAVAPALTSAAAAASGQLGFALGMKLADGSCKYQHHYEADFDAINKASGSKIVRVYSADQCNCAQQILPAAKAKGFKVVLGVWPDLPEMYNADKAAVLKYGAQYKSQVYAVTVGSEALYRGSLTAAQLVARIKDMRKAAPGFRYGTADTWNKFADGTANPLIPVSDIILTNSFSYWQGKAIKDAPTQFIGDIRKAWDHVRAEAAKVKAKVPELWVGETGWPSKGTKYQNAVPSVANAKAFFDQGVCPIVKAARNVFVFEAFDEPWKPVSVGQDGVSADERNWGVMDVNRKTKYAIKC